MKKFLIILAVIIVSIATYGYFQYNKPAKNIMDQDINFTMTANELTLSFNKNTNANSIYSNKVFLITGKVTLVEKSEQSTILILDNSIKCEVANTNYTKEIQEGSTQQVKGIFSGFDEMFNEITLSKCHILD